MTEPSTAHEIAMRIYRLSRTLRKVASWGGHDIADLVEEGYLEEGDLA